MTTAYTDNIEFSWIEIKSAISYKGFIFSVLFLLLWCHFNYHWTCSCFALLKSLTRKKKNSHLFHNEKPSIVSQTTGFKTYIFYKASYHVSIFLDKMSALWFASDFKLFSCYTLFNLIAASPCNYFSCCCNFPLVFFHSTLCGGWMRAWSFRNLLILQ